MKIAIVSGSPRKLSKTIHVMSHVHDYLNNKSYHLDLIDLADENIEIYHGSNEDYNQTTKELINKLTEADVWIIGTPIYNSFFSSAIKNVFEYLNYKNTSGKVAGLIIVASGHISFKSVQTNLTQLMSYFGVLTNPNSVYITVDKIDENNRLTIELKLRLENILDETIRLFEGNK